MWHLFEGGYYFPSLTVKRGVNSRAATKRVYSNKYGSWFSLELCTESAKACFISLIAGFS